MKKTLLIAALMTCAFALQAQSKAIGLRFAGGNTNGAEISFQMPMGGETNRLQLDLGGNFDSDGDNKYSAFGITGTYQWMWDLNSVLEGLAWYAGPGANVGLWSLDLSKLANDAGFKDKSGMNLAIGGIVGLEYNFADAPFQVSLDSRPMWNLSGADDYNTNLGASLAVRYKF